MEKEQNKMETYQECLKCKKYKDKKIKKRLICSSCESNLCSNCRKTHLQVIWRGLKIIILCDTCK